MSLDFLIEDEDEQEFREIETEMAIKFGELRPREIKKGFCSESLTGRFLQILETTNPHIRTILDFGCGKGSLINLWTPLLYSLPLITGYDVDREKIESEKAN